MRTYIFLFSIFFIVSCTKDDKNSSVLFSACIEGVWNCTYIASIHSVDTFHLFKDGIMHYRRTNESSDISPGIIQWEIMSDSISIYEHYDYSGMRSLFRYENIRWELLNSYESNNVLSLYIDGSYYDCRKYRIVSLNEKSMNIEFVHGERMEKYIFERIDNCQGEPFIIGEVEKPTEILGTWKMNKLTHYFSDDTSEYLKYSGDTIVTQVKIWDYGSNQFYLDVSSSYYENKVQIDKGAVLKVSETEEGNSHNWTAIWCWTDDNNPHASLELDPSDLLPIPNTYNLISIDNNQMILEYAKGIPINDQLFHGNTVLEYVRE